MTKVNWKAVAVFSVIVVIVFLVGLNLFGRWGSGNWGMMGPGMMGDWGYGTFGWIGMIFMWLIPVSFFVLTVLGIVWLVKALTGGASGKILPIPSCPSCGKTVQMDWSNCPYCGTALSHK